MRTNGLGQTAVQRYFYYRKFYSAYESYFLVLGEFATSYEEWLARGQRIHDYRGNRKS